MRQVYILIVIVLLLNLPCSYAQQKEESTPLYSLETLDGNRFVGTIVFEDEEVVRFKTQTIGEVDVPRKNIRHLRQLSGTVSRDGLIWEENLQDTRYFWAPNGYGLRKGEGYYQNLWVLFNQASVGLTENFSIGLGTVPLFLLGGAPTPVWVTPKISVPVVKDMVNLGGGALVGTVVGMPDTGFGILYGVSTFGTPDRNMTIGLGYGFAGGEWAPSPMINVSGIFRVTKNSYLMTENYRMNLGGESLLLLSVGARKMIRKVGLDFGLFIPLTSDIIDFDFFALPWLGFSVPFGNIR